MEDETLRAMHERPRLLVDGVWYLIFEGVLLAAPFDEQVYFPAAEAQEVDLNACDKPQRESREAIRAALQLLDVQRPLHVAQVIPLPLHVAGLSAARAFGQGLSDTTLEG